MQFRTNGIAVGEPAAFYDGSAAFTTTALGAATNLIAAEYAGDWLNPAATNHLNQVVASDAPVITGSRLLGGTNFQFSFSGPIGRTYQTWSATNLASPGGWSIVLSNSFGTAQSVFGEYNLPQAPARFYGGVSP